ncbi:MAG TPA: GatB/YqeY domain-containing protein [Solirubrobacteraceae bacterium]
MTIAETVRTDLATAMKARERDRVGTLRMVLSELQKAAKEGKADELAVLRRERKRRVEAERAYRDADRPELAEAELAEAELIGAYLPAELGDDDLREIVRRAVDESGATAPGDMGRVMPLAIAAVDGRADGRRISTLVREALARS